MTDVSNSWLGMASQRMEWLSERQRVITENVANADTPGYQARDVEAFEDFLGARPGAEPQVERAPQTWGSSLDGNSVVLEEQSLMSAETSGQFQLTSKLAKKAYTMMSMVNGK